MVQWYLGESGGYRISSMWGLVSSKDGHYIYTLISSCRAVGLILRLYYYMTWAPGIGSRGVIDAIRLTWTRRKRACQGTRGGQQEEPFSWIITWEHGEGGPRWWLYLFTETCEYAVEMGRTGRRDRKATTDKASRCTRIKGRGPPCLNCYR